MNLHTTFAFALASTPSTTHSPADENSLIESNVESCSAYPQSISSEATQHHAEFAPMAAVTEEILFPA